MYYKHSLVPRPLPPFQCCTQKRERAWYQMSRDKWGTLAYLGLQWVCSVQSRSPGYTKRLALCCAVAATCPSWILPTLNFTFRPPFIRVTFITWHLIPGPLPFLRANIEKVGVAWGRGYYKHASKQRSEHWNGYTCNSTIMYVYRYCVHKAMNPVFPVIKITKCCLLTLSTVGVSEAYQEKPQCGIVCRTLWLCCSVCGKYTGSLLKPDQNYLVGVHCLSLVV